MANTDSIRAPLARLAFVNLLTPQKRLNRKTGKEADHFNCNLLWPKNTDLAPLKALVVEAAVAEWGEKAKQMLNDGVIKNPFLDGDGPQAISKKTGERYSGYEGQTFVRVGSFQRPKMVNKRVEPITTSDELYSGCYVYAVLNAFTWTDAQGRGVSLGLSMLQVAKDGERLGGGGGGDPDAFFEKIEDDTGPKPAGSDGAAALFG